MSTRAFEELKQSSNFVSNTLENYEEAYENFAAVVDDGDSHGPPELQQRIDTLAKARKRYRSMFDKGSATVRKNLDRLKKAVEKEKTSMFRSRTGYKDQISSSELSLVKWTAEMEILDVQTDKLVLKVEKLVQSRMNSDMEKLRTNLKTMEKRIQTVSKSSSSTDPLVVSIVDAMVNEIKKLHFELDQNHESVDKILKEGVQEAEVQFQKVRKKLQEAQDDLKDAKKKMTANEKYRQEIEKMRSKVDRIDEMARAATQKKKK